MEEVFGKIQEQKEIRKEISREYKEGLIMKDDYEKLMEEIKVLRDKKKTLYKQG